MKLRLLILWCVAWIAACGGGGGVGEGGTGSFASGPITGFGSVIVNGVRFDDASASVTDDSGASRRRDELRLGMVVAIESSAVDTAAGTATARSIRISGELVGPASGIDAGAGRFLVLGQSVAVTADTIFDDSLAGGLPALQAGTVVEVYGFFDRVQGAVTATRVEPKAGNAGFKLRAPVTAVDVPGRTVTFGSQVVSLGNLTLPAGVAVGVIVRVQAQQVGPVLVATAIEIASLQVGDREQARVVGRVSAYTSSRSFSVDGLPVDASAAIFPSGEGGVLLGARVEVEGAVSAGTLVARKVEVENSTPEFRLIGAIENLDTGNRTFVLRGVTVRYPAGVEFRNGSEANLANQANVEVRGLPFDGGTRLLAGRIDFK